MLLFPIVITGMGEGYQVVYGSQESTCDTKGKAMLEVARILTYEKVIEVKEDETGLFQVAVQDVEDDLNLDKE